MARYRATLAYEGTPYYGFQRQTSLPSVQGTVEAVLEQIFGVETLIIGAGRTDTGVHAEGQVIAFNAEWKHSSDALLRAINARLPISIAVQAVQEVSEQFHPRYSALSRTYRYTVAAVAVRQPLLAQRAWQVAERLDESRLHTCASLFLGRHDFAAFGTAPQGNNTVREVYRSAWSSETYAFGRLLYYEVEATAFLLHMVRRLVGMQVAVGLGLSSPEALQTIFASRQLAKSQSLAPPQGLTLSAVRYPLNLESAYETPNSWESE